MVADPQASSQDAQDAQDYQDYKDYSDYQEHYGNQPKAEPDTSAMKSFVQKNLQAYQQTQEFKDHNPEQHPAAGYWDALVAGFQGSVTGLKARQKMPDIVLPEDANTAMKITSQIGSLGGDLPAMIAGGAIGELGGPVASVASAFALPAALRKIAIDHYQKGDITTPGEFADRLMSTSWEAIKGGVTGAATELTGGAAGAVAGPVAKFGGELAAMTTVSKALEGHLPSAEDFMNGGIILAGFHGAGLVSTKLGNIFAKTGEMPADVVKAAAQDVQLKQDLLSPDPKVPEQAQPTELKHYTEGKLVNENYDKEAADAVAKANAEKPEIPPPDKQWEQVPKDSIENPPPEGPAKEAGELPPRSDAEQRILSKIVDRPETENKTSLSDVVDAIKTAVKDDLHPLRVLTEKASDSGDLDPGKNPYILASNFRDYAGKIERTLSNDTFDFNNPNKSTGEGAFKILEDIPRQDEDGLNAYMTAKRVLEKSTKKQGISLDDARQVVSEREAEFGPVAQRLWDYMNRVKQYAVDSGILSKEKSELFDKTDKNYVPLNKLLDIDPLTGRPTGDARLFQAMGDSERDIVSPLKEMLRKTAAVIKAAEINRVGQAIINLPELDGFARQIDEPGPPKKNEMTVKVNGEVQKWAFEQPVADAIKAMDYQPAFTSLWAKIFAAPFKLAAKGLRVGVTGDIGFAARHGYRTEIIAQIQSEHPSIPFSDTINSIGEMFGHSDDFWKFISSGGGNGSMQRVQNLMNGRSWQNESTTLLQRAKEFAWPDTDDPMLKKAWNALWTPVKAAEAMTQISDLAPRFSEYKKLGGTTGDFNQQTYAANAARNISVDYQKQGALTKLVSFAQPFLNVDMQGTFRALEGLARPKTLAMSTALITLPEIVNFLYNHDDERYKNAPLWEHGAFMLVPMDSWKPATYEQASAQLKGMARQNQDGSYEVNEGPMLRIPRSFTLGLLFGSVPHMIMSAYYDHNPRAFDNLKEQVFKVLSPMGMTSLLQPMVEQSTNHSMFQGGPLVPDYLEKMLPQYQYAPYTSEVAKQVGKLIGHLPQIGPDNAPLSSPVVVDNYFKAWGGTVGGYVINMLDKGLHEVGVGKERQEIETTWTELPVVKEFFSHFPTPKAQSIMDFKANFAENEKYFNTVKSLYDHDQKEDADNLIQSHPDIMPRLKGINEDIKSMGMAISLVSRNPGMTPSDKRQLIDTLTFRMMSRAEQGNEIFKQYKDNKGK